MFVDDEGHVVLRPNNSSVRQGGQERGDRSSGWSPDRARWSARTSIHIAPVVRATVEVRNGFGHVDRETVDITLFDPASRPRLSAALHLPRQWRLTVMAGTSERTRC